MSSLSDKRVILGITGGIAAYKSAEIARRLQDQGASVRVVMTPGAEAFLRPLTMQALTGHPVHTGLLDEKAEAGMGHIELARWADLLLIAPASADFIANMVHGRADSLLGAVYLATNAITAIAPAMNRNMWAHPASQANIRSLESHGVTLIGPDEGLQACGDTGPGRMEQPNNVVSRASLLFDSGTLQGKRVVITAGPTREPLDPVRYISNHSSGKMGYALATAAAEAGAEVTLISGPVNLPTPERCERIDVLSADEMLGAALQAAADAHIFIATAAVADYKAANIEQQKIKSKQHSLTLHLEKNPDILSTVATTHSHLYVVGFAAESQDLQTYAKDKLIRKNLNAIVANDISRSDIGFNNDENEVHWIDGDGSILFEKKSKSQLAAELIEKIASAQHEQIAP